MHYLYRITDMLNDKVYIGRTVNEKRRWTAHKSFARQTEPIQFIHRAMKKYGIEHFHYEVIASCLLQEDADYTEIELINRYDSQNKECGYNVAPGGDHPWNAGLPLEQQPMYGKKQSAHQKQRASEVHSGKTVVHSEQTRNKISHALTGLIHSEERNLKTSGENSGVAKLTSKNVYNIRSEAPYTSYAELSRRYGTTVQNIKAIVERETWKNLPPVPIDWVKMILTRLGLKLK